MYGADGNRVVQAVNSGSTASRTVYVGLDATGKSLFERTSTPGAVTKNVNFIYAGAAHGGNAFAVRVFDGNGAVTANRYYSFDHLGSITAMSDEQGRVASTETSSLDAVALGYDAWGMRRNPDGTSAQSPGAFDLPVGNREFTGQEQIPNVALVNMNGRLYDPALGRFLSPDPTIQRGSDLQGHNRYTYVNNNPLRYTDPTGFFWDEIGHFFKSYFTNPLNVLSWSRRWVSAPSRLVPGAWSGAWRSKR
jgi:RHS repeat-associated protein